MPRDRNHTSSIRILVLIYLTILYKSRCSAPDMSDIRANNFARPVNRAMRVGEFRSSSQGEMRDGDNRHLNAHLVLRM
jgi:hypothetical protein